MFTQTRHLRPAPSSYHRRAPVRAWSCHPSPDNINTSLSAGVSEVVEIMMAKRREDRYNNVKELLADLEAMKNGRLPVQAHRRFDVSMLEQLEEGDIVEEKAKVYEEEAIANYRMAVLILSTVAAVFLLIIILFLLLLK